MRPQGGSSVISASLASLLGDRKLEGSLRWGGLGGNDRGHSRPTQGGVKDHWRTKLPETCPRSTKSRARWHSQCEGRRSKCTSTAGCHAVALHKDDDTLLACLGAFGPIMDPTKQSGMAMVARQGFLCFPSAAAVSSSQPVCCFLSNSRPRGPHFLGT